MRSQQVLEVIGRRRRGGACAHTRCPIHGRLLGAADWFPDGMWIWLARHRDPPQVARLEADESSMVGLEECARAGERDVCFARASEALSADTRPRANPSVLRVEFIESSKAGGYHIGESVAHVDLMSIFLPGIGSFTVAEVTCGSRCRYLLDIRALVGASGTCRESVSGVAPHVAPLPAGFFTNLYR